MVSCEVFCLFASLKRRIRTLCYNVGVTGWDNRAPWAQNTPQFKGMGGCVDKCSVISLRFKPGSAICLLGSYGLIT